MVGYTALMQENEQLALQKRDRCQSIFDKALGRFNGKLLQYYGDGTLSIFTSGVNAVRCAIEIQTLCRQDKIELRIGIHSGDVLTDENGIYGDSVNVASRIESLAVPGSIFISVKLYDEIKNHEGIYSKAIGFFELKNVKQPVEVFAISNEGVLVPTRDEVKGKLKKVVNSIAVLPFASLSSDPENEYFCDGITEELLNVLAKMDGLQVTSRTSSFAFKGKTEDIREIATKLNVQKVLEGSVRKSGNKVRITAQLINAADGYHLWSETYDRSLEDIFIVQDEIAREIAGKFRLNLNEQDFTRQIVKAPTENLQAYMKYLKAVTTWQKGTHEITVAMQLFEEAVQLDPVFAEPYSYMAFLYFAIGENGMLPLKEAGEKCRVAANKAMEISPENPYSLLASGIWNMMFGFNWKTACALLEKSLSVNPNSSFAWSFYSLYRLLMREFDDLDEYAKKIRAIDPLDAFSNGMIANLYLYSNQLEKAHGICHEFNKVSSEIAYITMVGLFVDGARDGWHTIIPRLEAIRKQHGPFPMLMGILGMAYATHGETEKAKSCIDWFEEAGKQNQGHVMDHVGLIYAALGMETAFYEVIEKGVAGGSIVPGWIYKSPLLPEKFRNDPRLRAIRIKMGLPV